MSELGATRFLSFLLLLFELHVFRVALVFADEMSVPYVPYVVVDKNKDEFDYDRLQDVIVEYLNRKNVEASTTLYDFLRTSTTPSETFFEQTNGDGADDNVVGVYSRSPPLRTAATYPAYPASIYKQATTKGNPLVTAVVKVTTYQPHKFTTPSSNGVGSSRGYAAGSSTIAGSRSDTTSRFASSANRLPFVPFGDSGFTPMRGTSGGVIRVTTETNLSAALKNGGLNVRAAPNFSHQTEMKCSLRSSRYVYDGECVSRKPVIETVCADRCIRYEYNAASKKSKKPYSSDTPKSDSASTSAGETKKRVVALSCSDGDVKKHKVKLYCKDGAIINNIIRIVENCVCREHSEKVHSTKRNQKLAYDGKSTIVMRRLPSRIRLRPNY